MEIKKDSEHVRIDKFAWSVRLYKTRSMATDACDKGWILINQSNVKPARGVNPGDVISIKHDFIFRQYKVLQLLNNRVGAKLVENYITEITSQEELDKLKFFKELEPFGKVKRDSGTGRPTKKDRRDLENYFE